MAFSIFFFASSLCSAGDPVSPVPAALESPLVKSDGLIAMLSLESVQDVSASLQPRLTLKECGVYYRSRRGRTITNIRGRNDRVVKDKDCDNEWWRWMKYMSRESRQAHTELFDETLADAPNCGH
jgi:hypothetical protein